MANYRVPGSIGITTPLSLEDGTLARWLSPIPSSTYDESPLYPLKTTRDATFSITYTDASQLRFLFMQCLSPITGLTEADFSSIATALGVDVASIKAVAEVESSGKAFDNDGRPRILFERHYFHRLTFGKHDTLHPSISNKASGGYGKFSAQYKKLEQAYNLDSDAALRSASWGRFQIMGNNFKSAGFPSIGKFVLAMTKSEFEHLKAFSNFVGNNKGMLSALRNKDWKAFARAYNGRSYKKNNYDTKLEKAYNYFSSNKPAASTKQP